MPSSDSKSRILYIYKILTEQTDTEHYLTIRKIITQLEEKGIPAYRKTVISECDNFGLDYADVASTKKGLYGYLPGFASWFVLQHYTGCKGQYKPFVTYIETEVFFGGSIEK